MNELHLTVVRSVPSRDFQRRIRVRNAHVEKLFTLVHLDYSLFDLRDRLLQ